MALRVIGLGLVLVLCLWLFIPTADVVCPDWTVRVVDTTGHPIEAATVTAFTQQYTLESQDVEQTKISGTDGMVHFDMRRIRANNLMRFLGILRNIGSQGAHASFGTHSNVHAFKQGFGDPSELKLFGANEKNSRANGALKQNSTLVLMKCASGYSGFGCDFPGDPSQPIKPLNLKSDTQQ